MTKQLSHEELQALAKDLDINTPIMSHRVVGDRIELHLLGGFEYTVFDMLAPEKLAPEKSGARAIDIPSLLADLSVKELRLIAKDLGISGYSKMKKAALVKALSSLDADLVSDTIVKLNL
jgi:hypothetical protein